MTSRLPDQATERTAFGEALRALTLHHSGTMARPEFADVGAGRVVLVRHGQVDQGSRLAGRTQDLGLNDTGRREAQAAARALAREPPRVILCSPRVRALETARLISQQTGAPLRIVPEFDEVDFGRWSGRTFESLAADPEWRRFNADRATSIPAGEAMDDVVARVEEGLARAVLATAGAFSAVITHAEIIRCAVIRAFRLSLDTWPVFEVPTASITTLVFHPGGGRSMSITHSDGPSGRRTRQTPRWISADSYDAPRAHNALA